MGVGRPHVGPQLPQSPNSKCLFLPPMVYRTQCLGLENTQRMLFKNTFLIVFVSLTIYRLLKISNESYQLYSCSQVREY